MVGQISAYIIYVVLVVPGILDVYKAFNLDIFIIFHEKGAIIFEDIT